MGWKAVSQILVILGSKYVGILLFQFDITELFNIELMEWFLVRKVAFEIRDNSIQASSSYAGPSVRAIYKTRYYFLYRNYIVWGVVRTRVTAMFCL